MYIQSVTAQRSQNKNNSETDKGSANIVSKVTRSVGQGQPMTPFNSASKSCTKGLNLIVF